MVAESTPGDGVTVEALLDLVNCNRSITASACMRWPYATNLHLLTRPYVGTLNVEKNLTLGGNDDLHNNVIEETTL